MIIATSIGAAELKVELAQLRVSNPTEYLERIKKRDEGFWLSELRELNPEALQIELQRRKEEADRHGWANAQAANTIQSYRAYIATYLQGEFVQEAEAKASALRTDQAPYDTAVRIGTEDSLRKFLTDYPGHEKEDEVQQTIKDIVESRLGVSTDSDDPSIPQEPKNKSAPALADYDRGVAAYKAGDYKTAIREFRALAEQGLPKAQVFLGLMFTTGEGVSRDYAEAVRWYRRAAKQGNARAEMLLGAMYDEGNGVSRDYAEAVHWYRLAAEQGNGKAQFNLGRMYYFGDGVPRDDVEAYMWISLATDQGGTSRREIRDKIAASLTLTQLREGQQRACEWREIPSSQNFNKIWHDLTVANILNLEQ